MYRKYKNYLIAFLAIAFLASCKKEYKYWDHWGESWIEINGNRQEMQPKASAYYRQGTPILRIGLHYVEPDGSVWEEWVFDIIEPEAGKTYYFRDMAWSPKLSYRGSLFTTMDGWYDVIGEFWYLDTASGNGSIKLMQYGTRKKDRIEAVIEGTTYYIKDSSLANPNMPQWLPDTIVITGGHVFTKNMNN